MQEGRARKPGLPVFGSHLDKPDVVVGEYAPPKVHVTTNDGENLGRLLDRSECSLGSSMILHAGTIFLSAALLFLVQLMVAKRLLPWFGGAPAVWTTCMLFFQVLLLAGYAHAHLLSVRLSARRQAVVQAALLVISATVLALAWTRWGSPVLPPGALKPETPTQPVRQLLGLLLLSVGLPFFVLSTTSPLLQRWHSLAQAGMSTYRLYAVSNAGSVLGLLAFPFLLEPRLSLSTLGRLWGVAYLLFVCGGLGCAWRAFLARESVADSSPSSTSDAGSLKPDRTMVALWILLPATTSAMFLSVTNNLCQEVAVVPFLWVVPLLIYLLSFIVCFGRRRWYWRRGYVAASAVSSAVVLMTAFHGIRLGFLTHLTAYGVFLTCFCVTLHGELASLKPQPRYLTLYYLCLAAGGAVGGAFVTLVAPMVFLSYSEFQATLMAGWIILAIVFARDRESLFYRGDALHAALLALLGSYTALRLAVLLTPIRRWHWIGEHLTLSTLLGSLVVTGLLVWMGRNRRWARSRYWPRILVGAVVFLAECFLLNHLRSASLATVNVRRDFYGVLRVYERAAKVGGMPAHRQLTHGQINHGIQYLEAPARSRPVGYYGPNSGIQLAFRHHARRASVPPQPINIGVLGLGVGTLASFARPGDRVRFYELNPQVAAFSTGPNPWFTYLRDCRGRAELALGDARITLEGELAQGSQQFDILVMDAFSSDAVPVHLLTTEAFELYDSHLRDGDGIIAVNISNRFLDFRDLMFSVARRFGWEAVLIDSRGDPPERTASRWVLLTRSRAFLDHPEVRLRQLNFTPGQELLWSDDYSDLFRLMF